MHIGSYYLTKRENNQIVDIYFKFKQSFSNCKLIIKKDIIGIGEDGKYLMCYFSYKDSNLFVKFKNDDIKYKIDSDFLDKKIIETIDLFIKNDFTIKERTNPYNSKSSQYADKSLEIVCKEYEKTLYNLSDEYNHISFDQCSNRLRNALYRNNIRNIKMLKSYPTELLLKLHFFGNKCLYELCDFLIDIGSIDVSETINNNSFPDKNTSEDEELEKRFEMLTYINSSKQKFTKLIFDNSYDIYINNIEYYSDIYIEFIGLLSKASLLKLTPKEQFVFNARFGINEEAKTLQEIGNSLSLTRERIRQIANKIIRKIRVKRLSNIDLIKLEYSKCKLIEKIQKISIEGFLVYIYFECNNINLLKLAYYLLSSKNLDINNIRTKLESQYYQYQQIILEYAKTKKFNDMFNSIINYQSKRVISDLDFSRLKTERVVNTTEDSLINFSYNDEVYQCESFLEKKILEKLLINNTFKKIKTQSIKIPFNNSFYYPDFQCLTHDNHLVIIEVKPLLNMCESYNIRKFKALKSYCERYGFGYLIVDDRNNSFFGINDKNDKFDLLILRELNNNRKLLYRKYKAIYTDANANTKNLLTLIRDNNLILTFPFNLTK